MFMGSFLMWMREKKEEKNLSVQLRLAMLESDIVTLARRMHPLIYHENKCNNLVKIQIRR